MHIILLVAHLHALQNNYELWECEGGVIPSLLRTIIGFYDLSLDFACVNYMKRYHKIVIESLEKEKVYVSSYEPVMHERVNKSAFNYPK